MICKPYKVLVVDDEQDIRTLIEAMLGDLYGDLLKVQTIESSEEALQTLKEAEINVLITDLTMPKILGESLIIETIKMQKGIQVMVVSGVEKKTIQLNCFMDGATSFIGKPFNEEDIKKAMDVCLAKLDFWGEFLCTQKS